MYTGSLLTYVHGRNDGARRLRRPTQVQEHYTFFVGSNKLVAFRYLALLCGLSDMWRYSAYRHILHPMLLFQFPVIRW